ncbi:hypothetical protein [Deinococcus phoenicis]|uniref:hypothetical protein n=1 Tax=Deinococcus phoenicis TaxID=1476583 RepID=UPI000553517D|nr:hypothetical protein [Deinococcus phoenicis]
MLYLLKACAIAKKCFGRFHGRGVCNAVFVGQPLNDAACGCHALPAALHTALKSCLCILGSLALFGERHKLLNHLIARPGSGGGSGSAYGPSQGHKLRSQPRRACCSLLGVCLEVAVKSAGGLPASFCTGLLPLFAKLAILEQFSLILPLEGVPKRFRSFLARPLSLLCGRAQVAA